MKSQPSQLSQHEDLLGGFTTHRVQNTTTKTKKNRQIIYIVHNITHIQIPCIRIPTCPKVLLAARLVFYKIYRQFSKKINNYASATDCL